jgi:hypothetical protein
VDGELQPLRERGLQHHAVLHGGAFTYFYTAITVNPNQLADDMKRNGGSSRV